ncbi:MAG: hypothetical protein ACFFCW_37030, partial [Candidatus Hodarchaeota archaeon]
VIGMIIDEERLVFETDTLMWLLNPFVSMDVRAAIRFGMEFGLDADKIFGLAEKYSQETGAPFEELDIVYIVYEHVLQEARSRIYEATGYDFINDGPGEICIYGNYAGTCYDYTEEARERLISEIANLDITRREGLLDEFLLRLLEYINITKADIEKTAEAEQEEILICR